MAPIIGIGAGCITSYNVTIDRNTTMATNNYHKRDQDALLYIVCTLLFYSLGIMVGIVSYIKREKRDLEQDRMFDEFLSSYGSKTDARNHRLVKVQETIERLAELESIRYLQENQFNNFGIRKISGISGKLGLLKVAKLGLIGGPESIMDEEHENVSKTIGSDNEEDPFEDRRLSEVVANILESEPFLSSPENDNGTQLVKYSTEPRNQELPREGMEDDDTKESEIDFDNDDKCHTEPKTFDLDKTSLNTKQIDLNNLQTTGRDRNLLTTGNIRSQKCKSESNLFQKEKLRVCVNDQHITTIVGRSIETVFGVSTQAVNTCDGTKEDTSHSEANLLQPNSLKDSKHVWSVTSV